MSKEKIRIKIKIKITKVNGSRDDSDTKPHKIAVSGFGWAYLLNKTQGNRKQAKGFLDPDAKKERKERKKVSSLLHQCPPRAV